MSEYTDAQLRIIKSLNPEAETYEIIEERLGSLLYDEAKELMETSFSDVLFGLPESTKEVIFDTAMGEANAFDTEEGSEPWFSVFNEYRDYMTMVKLIRLSQEGHYDLSHKTESSTLILSSQNGVGQAFSLFRSRPNMNEDEAREIMEACFQITASRLSPAARASIFTHGEARYSANGFAEVFEDYSASIQIAQMVVPEPEDYEVITNALSTRLQRESIIESFSNFTNEELLDLVENTENDQVRELGELELRERGL